MWQIYGFITNFINIEKLRILDSFLNENLFLVNYFKIINLNDKLNYLFYNLVIMEV